MHKNYSILGSLRALLETRGSAPVLWAIALVFYIWWITNKINLSDTNDFYVYYIAAAAFAAGDNAYALDAEQFSAWAQRLGVPSHAFPYYYPPLAALLVLPLTYLAPLNAALVWLLGSAAAMVGGAVLLGRSSDYRFAPTLGILLLLGFTPALKTMNVGQINGFLFLLLCAAFYCGSRQQWTRAGIFLSLGALIKIIPIVHIAHFLWQRRLRALFAALATLVLGYLVCLPLIGGVHIDPGATTVIERLDKSPWSNQALSGVIFRNIADPTWATWAWVAAVASVILTTIASCTRIPSEGRRYRYEFALILSAVTMIMPYTLSHQFILLVLPIFALLELALTERRRAWMLFPLIAVGITCSASNVRALQLHFLIDAHFTLCLLVWVLLVYVLWTESQEHA